MKIACLIIVIICLCTILFASVVIVNDYCTGDNDQTTEILVSAFCVCSVHGILALLLFPFLKKYRYVLCVVFLGYFAGIMGTNFVLDILSGEGLDSLLEYIVIVLFYVISVAGCVLAIQLSRKEMTPAKQEKSKND
jgi:hypothetical protein